MCCYYARGTDWKTPSLTQQVRTFGCVKLADFWTEFGATNPNNVALLKQPKQANTHRDKSVLCSRPHISHLTADPPSPPQILSVHIQSVQILTVWEPRVYATANSSCEERLRQSARGEQDVSFLSE